MFNLLLLFIKIEYKNDAQWHMKQVVPFSPGATHGHLY